LTANKKIAYVNFAKEKDRILALINPFLLSERKILKGLNFKTNLILKTKFAALSAVPSTCDVINFGRVSLESK